MTKSPRVTLVLTAGGRGGNGKTTALVALTDYLASKGIKQTLIDCDTENAGQPACFSHWLHGKGNALDLRNPIDRDRLLTDSAESGSQFGVDPTVVSPGAIWWRDSRGYCLDCFRYTTLRL